MRSRASHGPRPHGAQLDAEAVKRAYSRWALVYDRVFDAVFRSARRRAVAALGLRGGERVLEVGVGTGLSLSLYPAGCWVVGVDLSRPMLQRAARRLRGGLVAAADLVEADGARLPFPAGSFDAALASYVVSTAPDPVGLLREMCRVCRRQGRLVILNHFSSSHPLLAALERRASAATAALLGFRAQLPMEALLRRAGLEVEHLERVPPLGYWRLVRCSARRGG